MILEKDVAATICNAIGDDILLARLEDEQLTVFRKAGCFAEYAMELMKKCELQKLGECFRIADRLLLEGCASVKMAMVNVFVYEISFQLDRITAGREKFTQLMSPVLADVFRRQLSSHGV